MAKDKILPAISQIAGVLKMAIFGFNLETITLLALALVIGIIVDDAIVDVENITRHIENGETPRRASIIVTKEMGLINKNAILIVDYINQLRLSGLNRTEAILQAGPIRLRPILMTTASTILGMLPLALGLGAGAELRAPMAVAIIGGLTTATLLSLIVVPVVYAVLDDLRNRFSKGKRFV